jgi:colanic acid/amylovoran biosynthesis glycosyltransferase
VNNDSPNKPTVLIFKETLLPLSETFIAAQVCQLTRFAPRYVGLGRVSPSLPTPGDSILLTEDISGGSDFRQKLYRRIGIAPGFHRRANRVGARLIHAHFASGGRSALPLTRNLQIPLLVTLHGSDVTTRVNFRQRYAELWERASLFICVSNFIRKKALEAGFPEEKLRKLFIGVDRDIFRPVETKRDANLIVFVGRLVEKKGCAYLLQAMGHVQSQQPNARTVVIGDGPLRSSLEALAKELKVACDFLGSQPPSTVREWMSRARIFCAPSVTAANGDSEGLGMVFAEAQAIGTPVVTFNHGGIPEVVLHEETGLVAEERDVKGLASHVARLLEDDILWSRLSNNGITLIGERFDIGRQTSKLEELFLQVCGSTQRVGSEKLAVSHFSAASSAP